MTSSVSVGSRVICVLSVSVTMKKTRLTKPTLKQVLLYLQLIFTVEVKESHADRLSSGSSCTECSNSSQVYKSSVPGCSAEFSIYAWRVLLYGRADTKDWLDSRRLREIAV